MSFRPRARTSCWARRKSSAKSDPRVTCLGAATSATSCSTEAARMSRRIAADWIVPIARPPLRNGTLVLSDSGCIESIEPGQIAGAEPISGVLVPGLVNAHVHLELSALRGQVPGQGGFVPWVLTLLEKRRSLDREGLRRAIPAGIADVLRHGTVAVGEVTNTLD